MNSDTNQTCRGGDFITSVNEEMLHLYLSKHATSALGLYYFKDRRFSLTEGNDFFLSFFGKETLNFPEAFLSHKEIKEEDKAPFLNFFKNLETAEEELSLSFTCLLPLGTQKIFEIVGKREKDFAILLIDDKTDYLRLAGKFQLYQAVINERALVSLEVDLNENLASITGGRDVDQIGKWEGEEIRYTEFLDRFLSRIADKEEKNTAEKRFNIKNLIDSYNHNKKDIDVILSSLTCLEKKKYRVLNQLVKNPVTGHICSIFTIIDMSPFYSKIEELTYIADTDSLTKLYNRKAFETKIKPYFEDNNLHALFLLDIDDFKNINDQYGHMMGDRGLRLLANVLLTSFEKRGIVGRYGGDEFLVALKDGSDYVETKKCILQLQKDIKKAFLASDFPFEITISCGATFFGKGHHKTYETSFREVDKALYFAKSCGKNYVFFYRMMN